MRTFVVYALGKYITINYGRYAIDLTVSRWSAQPPSLDSHQAPPASTVTLLVELLVDIKSNIAYTALHTAPASPLLPSTSAMLACLKGLWLSPFSTVYSNRTALSGFTTGLLPSCFNPFFKSPNQQVTDRPASLFYFHQTGLWKARSLKVVGQPFSRQAMRLPEAEATLINTINNPNCYYIRTASSIDALGAGARFELAIFSLLS